MLKRNPKLAIVLGTVVAAAIVAVVLVLALGGGGGKKGPTKADYLTRSDAICRTTATRLTPLITRVTSEAPAVLTGGPGTAKRLATLVGDLHSRATAMLRQLRTVPEPRGDRAKIRAFLTPLGAVVTALGQAAAALAGGNGGKALQLFLETRSTAQQVTSAAQSYGYRQCSKLLSQLSS